MKSNSPLRYAIQIDGLRAMALAAVMADHYLPPLRSRIWLLDGVLLFFVISGFLITRILLTYRDEIEAGMATPASAFRAFYIRRALRIFPAYYVLVFAMIALGMTTDLAPWHLTYTTNIWSALHNKFAPDGGHFWSLSVEEQFYLCWPLIVIATPRKFLPWIMLALIAASLSFRALSDYFQWGLARRVLTIGNLYCLLAGSLLGWAYHLKRSSVILLLRRCSFIAILVLPFALGDSFLIFTIIRPAILALISVLLVDICANESRGLFGKIMSTPPITYLGRISYGMYLYHLFVMAIIGSHFQGKLGAIADAAIWTSATIALASASWFLMEKPINALKSNFTPIVPVGRLSAVEEGYLADPETRKNRGSIL